MPQPKFLFFPIIDRRSISFENHAVVASRVLATLRHRICAFFPWCYCLDSRYHDAEIEHPQYCTVHVRVMVDRLHLAVRAMDYTVLCTYDTVIQPPSSAVVVYQSLSPFRTSWNVLCSPVNDRSTNKHKWPHTWVFGCCTISVFRWFTAFPFLNSSFVLRYLWISMGVTWPNESK